MDVRGIFMGIALVGLLVHTAVGLVIAARVRRQDPGFHSPAGSAWLMRVAMHYDALCRERGGTTHVLVVAFWGGLLTCVLGTMVTMLASM